jgi:hypothetical protein
MLANLKSFKAAAVAQERQVARGGSVTTGKVGGGAFVPAGLVAVSCGWSAEIQRIPIRVLGHPTCFTTSKSALCILIGCEFIARDCLKATYLLFRYILGCLVKRKTIAIPSACP